MSKIFEIHFKSIALIKFTSLFRNEFKTEMRKSIDACRQAFCEEEEKILNTTKVIDTSSLVFEPNFIIAIKTASLSVSTH